MSKELLEKLKEIQKKKIEQVAKGEIVFDDERKITLYHGTTSKYLKNILAHGLQPRKAHGNSNYDENNVSNDELIYLTNYLQYRYAFSSIINNRADYEKEAGVEFKGSDAYLDYYAETGDVPIILEVEVPESWLYFDEDIAYFNEFRELYKNGIDDNDIDWKISMKQFTCTSLKAIPVEFIKKIEIVAYENVECVFNSLTGYAAVLSRWAHGVTIDEKRMQQVTEALVEEMEGNHMGAFDVIIPEPDKEYEVYFVRDDYCVFYKEV